VVEEQKLTGRSAGPAGPDAAVPDGGGDQQRQVLIDVLLSHTFVCLGVDLQRSVRFLFVSSPGFQVGLYSFISNDFCQTDYRNIHQIWWRGTVVERRSLTGELSLSCARPAADG